jgi:SAM-dependent methyltransferase
MPVPEQLYDALAAGYDAAWPAPAPELLEILREAGIGGGRILDVGVGTGIASQALAQGGATIAGIDPSAGMLAQAPSRLAKAELVRGRAEALPFADRSFDAAICADAFHEVNQPAALAELLRVVKPGGTIAIWWQTLSADGDLPGHRAGATADAGLAPIPEPLGRGFRAFYGAPFAERTLRVVPALVRSTVEGWMAVERARPEVYAAYGPQAVTWLGALEKRLLAAYGSPEAAVPVRLVSFVYLGRA